MSGAPRPILPGAAIGVLGSGQLGRMFAIAARRMGYRVHTLSPDSDSPTGQVADVEINAPYDDLDAVRAFAAGVEVVTFEFENVPAATAEAAASRAPVRPAGQVLHATQHRRREKEFLAGRGFPVTPFRPIARAAQVAPALADLGAPAVLKTAGFGYDGKGQTRVANVVEAEAAFAAAGGQDMVMEAFIDFDCELSVITARGVDGAVAHWGVMANAHHRHILDVTTTPAPIAPEVARRAVTIALEVAVALELVGVLCVEFFLARDGRLMINELAPRPHNSGHLTFDASVTSQFEQQLRAVCGLPLGDTELLRPAAMANLLGDLWQGGEPDWAAALSEPRVKLHLYGKLQPLPGRKMGHLTALAATPIEAERLARAARDRLKPR